MKGERWLQTKWPTRGLRLEASYEKVLAKYHSQAAWVQAMQAILVPSGTLARQRLRGSLRRLWAGGYSERSVWIVCMTWGACKRAVQLVAAVLGRLWVQRLKGAKGSLRARPMLALSRPGCPYHSPRSSQLGSFAGWRTLD